MRLQLETLFLDEKTCRISVRDAGFGEFLPGDRLPCGEDDTFRRQ